MDTKIENNAAAQSVVETDTTQTSSPPVEAQPTTAQTNDSSDVEADLTPEQKQAVASMTPEARKAFQEQRLEIKRLKSETEGRLSNESAFAPFKYQAPVNNETGYVDEVSRVRAEAAQAAREEIDEALARQQYPHLFNDKNMEKQIAAQWLYEKLSGNQVSIRDVSSQFDRQYRSSLEKAEQTGAKKALEQVTPKEQAALSASSQSSSAANAVSSSEDLEQLRVATRHGKEDAIVSRLRNIPWAGK